MSRCLDTKAIISKTFSAFVPVILLGCSTMPLGSGEALAQSGLESGEVVQSDMNSQLMFELMIAEMAVRRGQLDVALEGYLRAAERTVDPRVPEQAARLAMYARQWSEAERMAKRWLNLDPDNDQAPGLLAQALLRQEKTEQAVDIYQQALDASQNKRQVFRDIQFDLQNNRNAPLSVSVMQQLTQAYPNETEAHLGLARAHISNSDSDSAFASVETALKLSPRDTDALLFRTHIMAGTERLDEGLSLLSTALENDPDNTELRLGYAQLLVQSRRFDEVGEQLQRVYAESNENSQTRLTAALLAMDAQLLDQAKGYFTDLVAAGEFIDQSNFNLGRINDEQLNYSEAIQFYDSVGRGEMRFNAQLRAAELTALAGELDQARARLQNLAARVENPELQPRIVSVESRILANADQHAEAVNVLTSGLNQFPDDPSLLYSRALTAVAAGDQSMMVSDLERLILLEPENANALNALGYHFADEDIELERADQLLEKAIGLLPNDPAITDSLGWLRFRQGRFSEAVELLQQAYELFPDPEIAGHLAQALLQKGDNEQAQALVEAALVEDPEDARLLKIQEELIQ